jgi:site-specific DNA-methyltransferase (adenine-specific)
MYKITNANIKEWARDYDGEPFDAILCDPPYELGFMGKSWDSSGIAFDTDMWADLFRHVKPGGHLLAFSGSRTYHRMAVAIEDAGFEIRDMIEWVYGSGFPKSLNIGKAVDKIQGNEREDLGEYDPRSLQDGAVRQDRAIGGQQVAPSETSKLRATKGTSPYEGYGTALKPAHEPCVLARKPLEKGMTVATNALKHGTGGLNIDGSRVGTEQVEKGRDGRKADKTGGIYGDYTGNPEGGTTTGRFPANLIHDGSDEVVGLFPDTKQPSMRKGDRASKVNGIVPWNKGRETGRSVTNAGYTDIGSAARFFYTAKSSKSERNAGLEGFEERIKPMGNQAIAELKRGNNPQETVNNESSRFITKMQNHHPTVKPLSLTKYLANLIKPPTGGRLLVPFSGSGSEVIGGLQAGWEYVEGVELTEEYIPIAEARIKYWLELKESEVTQMELV